MGNGNCNSNRFSTDFADVADRQLQWQKTFGGTATAWLWLFPQVLFLWLPIRDHPRNPWKGFCHCRCSCPSDQLREIRGKAVAVAVAYPFKSSKSVVEAVRISPRATPPARIRPRVHWSLPDGVRRRSRMRAARQKSA